MYISPKDQQQEEKHLEETIEIIREKISVLGQEFYDKEEKIQEFKELIWDSKQDMDPAEMRFMMAESDAEVLKMERKSKYFQKLFKIQTKPYFGKVVFKSDQEEEVYIGITHVEDNMKYYVHDWRSPICSLFYDYETGPASYEAPEGIIKGNLEVKRQYNIENGILKGVFDTSINIEDEVLQKVLSEDSNDKMKNIVNTIQQEQNRVIRNTEDKVLIVQGIAGSGKTSVALHRIAFLLYKIKNLRSNNVLIFSPNKVFSEYISNVLPELGEDNTLQTTFYNFMESNIIECRHVEDFTNFIERYYKDININKDLIVYKQSDQIIEDVNKYITNYKRTLHFIGDYDTRDFTYTKEELDDLLHYRYSHMKTYEILPLIADKICNQYYQGKKTNHKKIVSALTKLLNKSLKIKDIYQNFYYSKYFIESYNKQVSDKEIKNYIVDNQMNYEDACIFLYMKGLLQGFDYQGNIKQIVIDEAQDYNKMEYHIIKNIFKKASYTILGDVNQTINPYYKYNSLEELKEIFNEDCNYIELSKTYRSSKEIIEYTNKILGLNHVTAIRKNTDTPVLIKKEENLEKEIKEDIDYLKNKYQSLAIITKNEMEAEKLYELLKPSYEKVSLLHSKSEKFNKDLVIVPAYTAKGLEFDSVIIYTDKENKYREIDKYLYYVACTRCQHELVVYNQ